MSSDFDLTVRSILTSYCRRARSRQFNLPHTFYIEDFSENAGPSHTKIVAYSDHVVMDRIRGSPICHLEFRPRSYPTIADCGGRVGHAMLPSSLLCKCEANIRKSHHFTRL